jgi:pimeloyl-ACP methyl ester carboxylesterase
LAADAASATVRSVNDSLHQIRVAAGLRPPCIADYVEDVRSVIGQLSVDPILVGHSMGGFIVQKHLESESARTPAAVLMSSAPPRTWSVRSMWAGRRHPWLAVKSSVTRNVLALYPDPAMVREGLFSPRTPELVVQACFERIQEESLLALNIDMRFPQPRPDPVGDDTDACSGRRRGVLRPRVARDVARAHRTEAVLRWLGHNVMLEPGGGKSPPEPLLGLVGKDFSGSGTRGPDTDFDAQDRGLFRDGVQHRSGLVDLVVGIDHHGWDRHVCARVGERFVDLIAEDIA